MDLLSTFELKENIEIDVYNYMREKLHLTFIDVVKNQVDHLRLVDEINSHASIKSQTLLNEKVQRIKSIMFSFSKGDRKQCADA